MWKPKDCDRCGGDMYKTLTEDGEVLSCLQCGRERELAARPQMSVEEVRALLMDDSDSRTSRAA